MGRWMRCARTGRGARRRRPKSSFSIALMCTTRRWIPSRASTNQGPEKGDLIPGGCAAGGPAAGRRGAGGAGPQSDFLLTAKSLIVLHVPSWLDRGGSETGQTKKKLVKLNPHSMGRWMRSGRTCARGGSFTLNFRVIRDQICTTFGPQVNCVRQVDF